MTDIKNVPSPKRKFNENGIDWFVTPGLKSTVEDFKKLYERMYSKQADNKIQKPLMICGDTGVGKSMYTHIFKKLYKEQSDIVMTLNCASMQSDLIISELFGHAKGAYTGAIGKKMGLLKKADGGLVILEEIGELLQPDQAKLLTFLENGGRFYPLGATEEEQTNVLIISTTNQPKDTFRDDFWSRFFQFYVPALYQRRVDVLYYFYNKFPEILKSFTQSELLAILTYHWPGNVREIENIGFLLKWHDEFRVTLRSQDPIPIGDTVKGILYNNTKYTSLNFDIRTHLLNLQEASNKGINISRMYSYLQKIGFQTFPLDFAFPQNIKVEMKKDTNLGITYCCNCKEFNMYQARLTAFCRIFLHTKIGQYGIPQVDTTINKDLLNISKNDMPTLTSRSFLSPSNFEENKLQK